ncbi:MAG: ATP-binding protein [Pirellulaceae bacterium]
MAVPPESPRRFVSSTKRLTLLYVLALSAVALLSIAGQILVQWSLVRQLSDSRVVNLAGRQRMLSQRLTMQSLLLQKADTAEQRIEQQADLSQSLTAWQRAHLALQQGDAPSGLPGRNSPRVEELFAQVDPHFQAICELAKTFLSHDPEVPLDVPEDDFQRLLLHQDAFLAGMDQIVDQYDREAYQRVSRLKTIELTLLFITLAVLLLEGTLVFRPAVTRLRNIMRQLAETSEDLARAKEVAEHANREKTNFLAKMSHELRTPMNAILGLSEVLRRAKLPPGRAPLVETIHDSARSLMRLLNDLLDMSKLEIEPTLPLNPQPANLAHLIRRACELFSREAERRGLRLKVELPGEMDQGVMVDEDRFRQVLVNLVQNALKFTERGNVTVRGEVFDRSLSTLSFRVLVRDTGPGIPLEACQSIFNPFRQADRPSQKRSTEGVGLGLSIARAITQAMGGSLELGQTSPEGTTFVMRLTLSKTEPGKHAFLDTRPSDATHLPEFPADLRILVVEDTAANQVVMDAMLAELGLRGRNVFTAAEAEETLTHWHPDCVLLDLELPDARGLELARRWRERYEAAPQGCPVLIAVTAHATAGHREACEAAGFDGFLTKPLSLASLVGGLHVHFSMAANEVGQRDAPESAAQVESSSSISEYPPALQEKLARIYLDQWSELLAELTRAAADNDRDQVVFYAHRLKGMVANFEAGPAQATLADVDRDDLVLDSPTTQADLERLPAELAQLADQVERRWSARSR